MRHPLLDLLLCTAAATALLAMALATAPPPGDPANQAHPTALPAVHHAEE